MIHARVKALAYGGAFVCDVDSADELPHKKAFIREVIPGELVAAEVTEEKKNLVEAKLTEILEPSPARISPPCPLYGSCGGCDLQHMAIQAQRLAKLQMVRDTIRLHAGIAAEEEISLIGQELPEYYYRKRILLHCDSNGAIGFYRSGSGEIVDTPRCLLAGSGINMLLARIRECSSSITAHAGSLILEEHDGETFAFIKLHPGEAALNNSPSPISAIPTREVPNLIVSQQRRTIYARFHGVTIAEGVDFPVPVGHFSQINEQANQILVKTVLNEITSPTVTDFYAGAGNFSLPMARHGAVVTAIELDSRLTAYGEKLTKEAELSNRVFFKNLSCEKYLKRNSAESLAVLDPPRQGACEVVKRFNPMKTGKVVYVSCSLPTLCRDLKILVEKGYRLQRVFVLDMFPQTHHVETVSVLISDH